jgi:hypothetical protein
VIIRSPGSFPGVVEVADAWYLAGGAPMPMAAYQPIGAASLADSYVNLANPGTLDAAPGVAPTWNAATGWGFNSAQYLTTGVVPGDGWSMLVRMSDVVTTVNRTAGGSQNTDGDSRFYVVPRSSGNSLYGHGTFVSISGNVVAGIMAIAGQSGYLDGAEVTGALGSIVVTPRQIIIGALNAGAGSMGVSPSQYLAGNIQAVAIYDSTLTASEVAAVSDAMAAL